MQELSDAFTPIYYWSKLFGIPLKFTKRTRMCDPINITLHFQRKWSSVICLLCFTLNIGGNIAFLAFVHETSLAKSSTRNWNYVINRINYSFATMAIHSTLLFRTCIHWPKLVHLISSWESSLNNKSSQRNYRRLKHVSLVCSTYVLLVS